MSAPRATLRGRSVGVLGGGVAGLALAALLARRGARVTVYERDEPGGKLRRLPLAPGVAADAGPSILTFPGVWRRLLARLGAPDPLDLVPLPGLGPHVSEAARVPLPVPPSHPLHAAWARYEAEAAPLAPHVETLLVTPPRPNDPRFARASLALGRVIGPHVTARAWLRARRLPPALEEALAVHALNAGVGPRAGSALYALLPGLVAGDVWRPRGGMFALAAALVALGEARGVRLRAGTPVLGVDGEGGEVRLAGETVRHDLLVSALDPDRLAALRGRPAPRGGRPTVSGLSLHALLAAPSGLPPATVVLPSDLAAFEAAMRVGALPRDTMALVHADGARLDVLLTVPPDGRALAVDHPWVRGQLARVARLAGAPDLGGPDPRGPAALVAVTPADLALGGAPGGAIYGRAFAAWRSGPFHPQPYRLAARLWQVGTGVHPGGGLPAVLGGALIVDELLGG